MGDFNDPAKARELAEAMIADGADVLVGSLNRHARHLRGGQEHDRARARGRQIPPTSRPLRRTTT
ncbi:MAG: hypothetical protein R2851_08695 [Caldilineaceae bacterium]